ncbi:MAG TPA: dynamin family protein [Actinocrinis sp.]|nr:dynamin family protein [Actinocrinis sp.]
MTVMEELDALRQAVLALLPRILRQLGTAPPALAAALEEHRRRLAEGRYHLVVCGEFRRGKSSLLNALIGRPGLFPVDVDVTTSAITTLSWGEQERALVHFAAAQGQDAGSRPPQQIPIERIKQYVTEQGNPENAAGVSLVEITAPLDQLKSGLVLVDAPGTGSVNPAHSATTWAFLGNADAVLFVASSVEPLGTLELEFLGRALDKCDTVITAVTMIDKVVDPEPVIEATRERIAKLTGRDAGELTVIGVSALRKLDAIEDGDDALLEASGLPALEHELWGGLAATCGVNQITAALDGYDDALEAASAPLQNELAGLLDGSALEKLDADLRAQRDALQQLRSAGHRWRRDLAADLDVAARPIRQRLSDDFDEIRDRFRKALSEEQVFADPAEMVRRISLRMVDAAETANRSLAEAVEQTARQYSALADCRLTGSAETRTGRGELRADRRIIVHGAPSEFARFRTKWVGGRAGLVLGGLVGGVIAIVSLPVGALIGLVGGLMGWRVGSREAERNAAENRRREHVAALRDQVLPQIESARRQTERDLSDELRDQTRALTSALEDHIALLTESLGASVDALKAARSTTARERPARINTLTKLLAGYARLQEEIEALRARADQVADQAGGR